MCPLNSNQFLIVSYLILNWYKVELIDSWGGQKGSSKFSRIIKSSWVLICFHMYVLSTFVLFYNVCIESSTVFSSTGVSRIETESRNYANLKSKLKICLLRIWPILTLTKFQVYFKVYSLLWWSSYYCLWPPCNVLQIVL